MEKFIPVDICNIGNWKKFDPKNIIKKGYDIKSITDSYDGFEIILSDMSNRFGEKTNKKDRGKNIRIFFDHGVDLYRNIYESFSYGSACGASLFVKINNSKYIDWLMNESCCLGTEHADNIGMRHFMFIGLNDVLDIIACYDPIIEYV